MAMIPSGYKPTKLYSVLPTETYGVDLITNGDFSNGSTDWSLDSPITISGGTMNFTNVGGKYGSQNIGFTDGTTYIVKFEITEQTSGSLLVFLGAGNSIGTFSGLGKKQIVATSDATFDTKIYFGNNFAGSIDNISVQEVLVGNADFDVTRATPATRVNQYGLIETPEFILSGELITNGDFSDGSTDWTLESGWSVSGGVANTDGTINKNIKQNNVTTIGKQYKYSFDVLNSSVGDVRGRFRNNNGAVLNFFGDGTYSGYFVATNTSINIVVLSTNTATFSIDNISVVEVERNNIPRLDYTDGGCPVLLTEPQSTNLVTNSNDMLASNWSQTTATVTLSSNLNPSGDSVCYRVERIGSGAQLGGVAVATIGQTYTSSVYIRRISGSGIVNMKDVNNVNAPVTITDEWQRYSVTGVANSANARYYYTLGSDGDVIEASFAQIEKENTLGYNGEYATSYIPTYNGIVSRNQDLVNNAGTSATYNSEEGVLFAEIAALADDGKQRRISLSDGTNNNRVVIYYNTSNQLLALVKVGGVTPFAYTMVTDIKQLSKIGLKWKQDDFALWVNGVEVATDTSGNTFAADTLDRLAFTDGSVGTLPFFGKTSQVQVFNTALSNFDLLNLTSNATGYATYETMRTSLNFNIQ